MVLVRGHRQKLFLLELLDARQDGLAILRGGLLDEMEGRPTLAVLDVQAVREGVEEGRYHPLGGAVAAGQVDREHPLVLQLTAVDGQSNKKESKDVEMKKATYMSHYMKHCQNHQTSKPSKQRTKQFNSRPSSGSRRDTPQ